MELRRPTQLTPAHGDEAVDLRIREGKAGKGNMMDPALRSEPIDRLLAPLERFLHVEAAGGVVLLACTVLALVLANSPLADAYQHIWHTPIGVELGALHLRHTLEHWINDGLMVLFFFVVGLEVKRELVLGELRNPRAAALPLIAAVGGMVVPAGCYLALRGGTETARGWGIPMATDIAFVVGCLAVLGRRIPPGLRVLLLPLAIADDIGAILVIAVGYSSGIAFVPLALGFAGIAAVVVFQRVGIRARGVYVGTGIAVWLAFLHSGVHATIAGVLLGLLTPARSYLNRSAFAAVLDQMRGDEGTDNASADRVARVRTLVQATRESVSPLEYIERRLHPWVSFGIMPVFALANAGMPVRLADMVDPVALAVGIGLLLGKPVGVFLFAWIAVVIGAARLPEGVSWAQVAGGGVLCGIGFTMALFIASLALSGASLDAAKVGILCASAGAAAAGMLVLWLVDGDRAPRIEPSSLDRGNLESTGTISHRPRS